MATESWRAPATLKGRSALLRDSTFSPGNSPGTLVSQAGIIEGGGSFVFEINDALGTAGANPGWDLWSVEQLLTVKATSANPFIVQIESLDLENKSGLIAGFDPIRDFEWMFITAGQLDGMGADAFRLDSSRFLNDLDGGVFSVFQNAEGFGIRFTGMNVPEPSSLVVWLLIGICGVGAVRRARRGNRGACR